MNKTPIVKDAKAVIKDVDSASRTVTGYFNSFGVVDSDRQMSMAGSFTKTAMENGPEGTGRIAHVSSHRLLPEFLLARPKVLKSDGFGLYFESEIANTTHGNDILKLYETGLIKEHSCMVVAIKTNKLDNYEEVFEWKLIEGSTVVFGANAQTPFMGMKSLLADPAQLLAYQQELFSAYRKGTFSDETFEAIEYAIKTITQYNSVNAESKPPPSTLNNEDAMLNIVKQLQKQIAK